MLTIEYQTEQGEWKPATIKTWATRRGVDKWLNDTWDGASLRYRHERIRITGTEERRQPLAGADPKGWVHVGDIFHHHWGYGMSINDFYEVVAVSKSGKTCTLRQIATLMSEDSSAPSGGWARPQLTGDDRFVGDPITSKRVRVYQPANGRPSCTVSMGASGCATLMEPEDYVRGYYENHND